MADLPVGADRRQLDLAEDEVDDAVQDPLLVGEVVVERHRLDAERLTELAHAERLEPALIGELQRGLEHPLPGQRERGAALGCVVRVVMDSFLPDRSRDRGLTGSYFTPYSHGRW